ncbi:inner ear-specific collagen-like [Platichthys flesus]|uniref:inner ear-specific collagen-like n=1 Tax=Platichthys flesus TaxID=8260 RepID=UPI002DB7A6E0|nr:inner ear-specific collagen-like [Platichthys flesus]
MVLRLLGLLVLSSLCSAMLLPNMSPESSEEDGSTSDPKNDSDWEEMPKWPPMSRSGLGPAMPPWPDSGNMTNDFNKVRMLQSPGPIMPPISEAAICDVLLNSAVPPPLEQIPPFCICTLCKGTTGPKGDRGDRGFSGEPGSPGRRGMTGFRGRAGFTGHQGMKGQKGDLGKEGQDGPAGFTGAKGAQGFKGDKGDTGLIGPPGTLGPQGETGTCPASCDSGQGTQGPQGPPGPAGARGLPGVEGVAGPKGFKGDNGVLGKPGEPGLNGQKGDQGDQGVCECTDGMNGTDGRPGEKGNKGNKGDTGVQGAMGPIGPKGDHGINGFNGPPGPCSIAIQSAFSASVIQSSPIPDWPIPFPRVLLNWFGHFDPLSGIYTAPVNGTYVFSFHLVVSFRTLKVGLFHNFYPVVKTTETRNQATASQSVVRHLTQGDQVWLQVKNNNTNGIYTDSESSSTFSGYLLHPDSCEMPFLRGFLPDEKKENGQFGWDGPPNTTTPPHTTTPPP